ncbi:MAG: phytanoyl-CoA dioxygenase family protein [Caldilineaceae bacterium]|nr:phytanoyl-CoA dioxygenase family protein [Caldilineaceae bacterium]
MQKVETFDVKYNQQGERVFDYGDEGTYRRDLYAWTSLAQGVNGFDQVTAAQIAQFHEQGYLVVNNAFTPTEVQDALDGLLYLLSGQKADYQNVMFEKKARGAALDAMPPEVRQDYVRKFMWFVDHDVRLHAMAHHPQLIDLATRLIGEQPAIFQDMALLKPPKIGREKPWHQDHAYFDLPLTTTVVGVWIALDEATTDNGCMVIYPNSHKAGPVIHFQRRDWQICDSFGRQQEVVAVPLKPGGALFFHSLIQHGTPANSSTARRRAVQFHYAPASAKKADQSERLALFGSEGKDVTC